MEEKEILPDEVLGWILLRRAGVSTQNRLAVQASVGNSLRYEAIERALRDQEEELLAAERRPQGKGHGFKGGPPKRTFWVEENKEGGWLDFEPDQEEVPVHWIGQKLPDDVHQHSLQPEPAHEEEDASWHQSSWDDHGWANATWWGDNDTDYDFAPKEQKQLDEIYAAYEDKVRSFVQARALMKNKVANRGKSSSKGKPKGPPQVMAASTSGSSTGKGRQRPGEPEYILDASFVALETIPFNSARSATRERVELTMLTSSLPR